MKSVIISSNCSGGGKTTVTIALMKALKDKGYNIAGYKIGPDYIDPAFHKKVLNIKSKNLDLHLMGEVAVKESYSNEGAEISIIEGVMGLYDGMGIDGQYSTYEISKTLGDMPIVLVLNAAGKSTTIAAEINGLLSFKKANIVGVIFNSINKGYYYLLKSIVEEYCNLKVFGFIPKDERIKLESRHLGLVQAEEVKNLKEKISIAARLVEENIDLDLLLNSFKTFDYPFKKGYNLNKRVKKLKIAIALDEAFNFYYEENINILKEIGEIIYFSPLKDEKLPKDIDFIYIGGGYPEIFKEKLSANKSMLNSVKKALESGIHCYAECGGLMYLTDSIDGYNMVGFFKGSCKLTDKLQNFGYATIESLEESGLEINCHEFHKSIFETNEPNIYKLKKINYLGKEKRWNCGYRKKNTRATYAHIHFLGNLKFLDYILPNDK